METSSRSAAGAALQVDLLLETGGGGAGRHVLDLYKGLRQAGLDARLVLSSRRAEATFAAEVAALPQEHVTFLDLRRSPHLSDLRAVAQLKERIRRSGRQHLLHVHSTKGGIIGWALGAGTACRVLTPHAYRGMDTTLKGLQRAGIRTAEAIFSRCYDGVIAVSQDELAYMASLGVAEEKSHYVPNGVDGPSIARIAQNVRAQHPGDVPVVGFVGRLVYQKNPELFLETVAALQAQGLKLRVVLVGDGELTPDLRMLAERLNIAGLVEWRGNVDAVQELGKMDVLVHTSRYESFPYVLLESVAAAVPVVSVENAGSRAVFSSLCPEAIVAQPTATALAARVMEVLLKQDVRASHLSRYPQIVDAFSLERMVQRTIAVYDDALSRRATRPRP